MRVLDVLNLGAGIGSTTVYIMILEGKLPPIDAAIIADTGEEPEPVYRHLEWLKSLGGPRIIVAGKGRLGDDLIHGSRRDGYRRRDGGRFASIPAYTATKPESKLALPVEDKADGILKRQCTKEYKIDVVEKTIRRELLNLKARQRIPKGVLIRQHFGLSDDEPKRIKRVKKRFESTPWGEPVFPLVTLGMTRLDCIAYLKDRVPHTTPRSACTFCPFRSDEEWVWLRDNDPDGWSRAVEIDAAIRDPSSVCTRGMVQAIYLHRTCIPLPMVDIDAGAAKEKARREQRGRWLFDPIELADCDDAICIAGMCGV